MNIVGVMLLIVGLLGLAVGLVLSQTTHASFWDVWNIVCGIATLVSLGLTLIPYFSSSSTKPNTPPLNYFFILGLLVAILGLYTVYKPSNDKTTENKSEQTITDNSGKAINALGDVYIGQQSSPENSIPPSPSPHNQGNINKAETDKPRETNESEPNQYIEHNTGTAINAGGNVTADNLR